jgi:hypothetical protein
LTNPKIKPPVGLSSYIDADIPPAGIKSLLIQDIYEEN